MSLVRTVLKPIRDLLSDSTAKLVGRFPALEMLFLPIGRNCGHLPVAKLLHRRSVETLSKEWTRRGRNYRKVAIERLEFVYDVTDFSVSSSYFQRSIFEPRTTRWLQAALGAGQSFVDIGANRGYYAIQAALLVGASGKVFAFEPNPDVMAGLLKHLELNQLKERVELSPLALADAPGELDFYLAQVPSNSGLSSLQPSSFALSAGLLSLEKRIKVRATTYDAWAHAHGLFEHPADVLKIDVEGAELRVFQGMAQALREAPPPHIICETSFSGPSTALLKQAGYQAEMLDNIDGKEFGNILFSR